LIAAEIHKTSIVQISTHPPRWNHDLLEHFIFSLRFAQSWEAAHVYRDSKYLYSYGWTPTPNKSGEDRWERQAEITDTWSDCLGGRCYFAPNGLPEGLDEKLTQVDKTVPRNLVCDEPIRWDDHVYFTANGTGLEDLEELAGIQIIFEFTKTAVLPPPKSPYMRAFCRELQNQQLDVLRTVRPAVRMRRGAVRNAVSAIMGRNMSHNIGSHVLARLAASELQAVKSGLMGSAAASRGREALLSYLQRRMDFVAEVSTADRAYWSQPLSLQSVVSCLNFADEYKRITTKDLPNPQNRLRDRIRGIAADRRPLLLSYITGKESLSASVEFGCPEQANAATASTSPGPTFFSCPGGEVGAHALLVILENVIRNSARHGDEADANNAEPVVIHVVPHPSDSEPSKSPFIEVRIVDLHTRLTEEGKKSTADAQSVPQGINAAIHASSLIDQAGQPNPRNWGVREMQICAHYLRHFSLSTLESVDCETRKPPVLEATIH